METILVKLLFKDSVKLKEIKAKVKEDFAKL